MDSLVQLEWDAMPQEDRQVVLYAYHWGAKRGYREMGAHYAVESRGKMRAVRLEANGSVCVGPGQNNVAHAATRTFGRNYTAEQYLLTESRLQSDLDYCLRDSWAHQKRGLKMFKYRWNVWKYYNNINAESEAYPARIQAWLAFLDELQQGVK